MSVECSSLVPNNWEVQGEAAPQEQCDWYETMLSACEKRPWIDGMAFWSWGAQLYPEQMANSRKDYEVFGKPAEACIKEHYCSMQQTRMVYEKEKRTGRLSTDFLRKSEQ